MTSVLKRMTAHAAICGMLTIGLAAAGPGYVDITWMSISNMYYEIGGANIVTDGYISRLPQSAFSFGGGGLWRKIFPTAAGTVLSCSPSTVQAVVSAGSSTIQRAPSIYTCRS